jgi:hypothetical protein
MRTSDQGNTAQSVHDMFGKLAEIGSNSIPAESAIQRPSAEAVQWALCKDSGDRRLTRPRTPYIPTARGHDGSGVDFMHVPF